MFQPLITGSIIAEQNAVVTRVQSLLALPLLLAAPVPVAAQDVQGPPDGFRGPQDVRQPAQGPADNGIPPLAVPTPTPAPAPSPRTETAAPDVPGPERGAAPAPVAARPAPRTGAAAPVPPRPATAEVSTLPATRPDGPAPTTSPAALQPANDDGGADGAAVPPLAKAANSTPDWLRWWPAALALLLAAAGALLWMRRPRAAAPVADTPPPRQTNEAAPARPVPPPRQTPPSAPVPPPPASSVPPETEPALFVPETGRARLSMTLQMRSIEIMADSARFTFSLLLANRGDRLASGGLVRIALQQANAHQKVLLERFFDGAGGSVLADDVEIPPGEVGAIEQEAILPLSAVEPMLIGGYPSMVPVLGFDVTYHWDGDADAFGQVACAFVLGGSTANDGRVAPLRLDRGPHRISAPVARATEMQRNS